MTVQIILERKPVVMWIAINITEKRRVQIERDKVTEEFKPDYDIYDD
jgi:hypothetical protein